jgi:hypothetical protein
MNASVQGCCRRSPCSKSIPIALVSEQLCLDHFLDEAFVRTDHTFDRCREGRAINATDLERLLADSLAIVKNLEEGAGEADPAQRDKMLELLLILANLHEYVVQHSVPIVRPA